MREKAIEQRLVHIVKEIKIVSPEDAEKKPDIRNFYSITAATGKLSEEQTKTIMGTCEDMVAEELTRKKEK